MDPSQKSTRWTDAEAAQKLQAILDNPARKTTALELLQIGYHGQWMLPGGDPDLLLDAPVELGELRPAQPGQKYSVGTIHNTFPFGYAPRFVDFPLALNPSFIAGDGGVGIIPADPKAQISVLGAHEGLHVLQNLVHFLDSAIFWDKPEESVGFSRRFGHGPELERNLRHGESPEERKEREEELLKTTPVAAGQARGEQRVKNIDSPEYNFEYPEIQGCLSQLIASNEPHWKKRPSTSEEVRDAFYGFMLGTRSHPDYPLAAQDDLATMEAAKELRNATVGNLAYGQQERFFYNNLQGFYGDLSELRCNPKGRQEMGLRPNAVAARAFLWQMIREQYDPTVAPWSEETWRRVGAKVEPEALARLQHYAHFSHMRVCQQALGMSPEPEVKAPPRFDLAQGNAFPSQRVTPGVIAAPNPEAFAEFANRR